MGVSIGPWEVTQNGWFIRENLTKMDDYLLAHPTHRKWVTTLVINGISGGNVHL